MMTPNTCGPDTSFGRRRSSERCSPPTATHSQEYSWTSPTRALHLHHHISFESKSNGPLRAQQRGIDTDLVGVCGWVVEGREDKKRDKHDPTLFCTHAGTCRVVTKRVVGVPPFFSLEAPNPRSGPLWLFTSLLLRATHTTAAWVTHGRVKKVTRPRGERRRASGSPILVDVMWTRSAASP